MSIDRTHTDSLVTCFKLTWHMVAQGPGLQACNRTYSQWSELPTLSTVFLKNDISQQMVTLEVAEVGVVEREYLQVEED